MQQSVFQPSRDADKVHMAKPAASSSVSCNFLLTFDDRLIALHILLLSINRIVKEVSVGKDYYGTACRLKVCVS